MARERVEHHISVRFHKVDRPDRPDEVDNGGKIVDAIPKTILVRSNYTSRILITQSMDRGGMPHDKHHLLVQHELLQVDKLIFFLSYVQALD